MSFPSDLDITVRELSLKEGRAFSNMVVALVREALQAREANGE